MVQKYILTELVDRFLSIPTENKKNRDFLLLINVKYLD